MEDQKSETNRSNGSSTDGVAIYVSACSIPVVLLLAHLSQGADTSSTAALLVATFGALFIISTLMLRLQNITIGMFLVACLFLTCLSLGKFGNWHQAQHEIQTLLAAGAVIGLGYTIARQPGGLKYAWSALIWTLLLFALLSAISFLTQDSVPGTFGSRLSGGFGSPNTAATLFGIAILLASAKILVRFQDASLIARPRGDRVNMLARYEYPSLTLLIVAAVCLVFTVSRAGIVFGLISFIGLVAFETGRMIKRGRFSFLRRRGPLTGLVLFGIAILALAITGEINPANEEGLFENAGGRVEIGQIYWNVFLEKPWFGHGLGSFNAINDEITTLENASTLMPLGAAHNVILQWLVQQGVVGLLVMTFVFGVIFYPIIRALAAPSKKPRNFLRLTIAITFLVFAHGMVDYALEIPSVMWTYAYILGLASGYASLIKVRRQEPDE